MTKKQKDAAALLRAGALGAVGVGLIVVGVFYVVSDTFNTLSAALGVGFVLIFFGLGQVIQVIFADLAPSALFLLTMTIYFLRVVAFGAVLFYHFNHPGTFAGFALAIAIIVATFGWILAMAWRFSKLRILIYDE